MTAGETPDSTLPNGADVLEPAPNAAAVPAPAVSGQRTVVVAEDEALIRLDIVEMLRENDYNVVGEAGDGEEAVRLAEQHRPDLVVMDIKMPILDGISAAERIVSARIAPVVLLTAFSQRELVERARDAGAMAYVVKPFTAADLMPALEIAASRHSEIAALEAEVADEVGIPMLPTIGMACGRVRCPVIVGRVLVYRDSSHLSTVYVEHLSERLDRLLIEPTLGRDSG